MEITFVLPDTNVLIPALAGLEPYAGFLRRLIESKRLVLSVVVIAEFLVKATEEEERVFDALIKETIVLPIDLTVARLAALYRKNAFMKNKNIKLPDCLIAATVKAYKATLATLDRKDYPIKEIEIIDDF